MRDATTSIPSSLLQGWGLYILNCRGDEADGERRGERLRRWLCIHSPGKAPTVASQGGKQVVDHGYGLMGQVSGTTTHNISYNWAHQPLADISVYNKTHPTPAPYSSLADPWHAVGAAAAALPLLQTLPEVRRRDCCALPGAGRSQGPLTKHAGTQHEQSQRGVPCSMPMCWRRHTQRAWAHVARHVVLTPHVLPATSMYLCAGNPGRW